MNEREIYAEALQIESEAERAAFLDHACGGDAALRERVMGLLAEQQRLGDFLEVSPAAVATIERVGKERPGTRIGRYRLLEQLGEGGMGTVWVAEQTEPVKRRVALKLIKPGMDTRQVLSRFEAERQALALMDHPNIAKVYDGGMTDEGRPYFVMEYVKGVPITAFCDIARLPIAARLKLFIPVCQAIQHAHHKGVIHRDLKPSNILVCLYDGEPVPKVIDFGLAKAMHQPLTEHTLYTAHGLMVGTPLYMSPEQAEFNNLDVDTRTDVYSLGVILYELLTGTTPLENRQFKDAAFAEILRLIKEVEPQKPSTKLSGSASLPSIAAQRGLEPAQLSRLVRGDLDWIVMKSLEKERSRRYETANGLARDIERFLGNEPVHARPPSTTYRLRKFAQRNKAAVGAALLIAASLLLGTAVSTWQAIRATAAERRSQENLRKLQQVAREWATSETLTGDPKRAETAIRLAEAAQVSKAWTDVLRAQSEFDQGLYQGAIDRVTEIADDSDMGGDRDSRLAALAITASAHLLAGHDAEYIRHMRRIRAFPANVGPEATLFRAITELSTEPERGIAILENAASKRVYPALLTFRAYAYSQVALQKKDYRPIQKALDDLHYAELFSGATPSVVITKSHVHTIGYEFANASGDAVNSQRHLDALSTLVVPLEKLSHSPMHAIHVIFAYEKLQQVAKALDFAKSVDWSGCGLIEVPAALMYEHMQDPQTALTWFDQLKTEPDNPNRLVARAHFCAETASMRSELPKLFERIVIISPDSVEAHYRALDILALAGMPDELKAEAKKMRVRFSGETNFWGMDEATRYLADEYEIEATPLEPDSSAIKQCAVYHAMGIHFLAAGNRERAKHYFERCVQTGVVLLFPYFWSKAYLARMARDPNWPDWIEAKQ